jgi:two-component system, NarL family, response regulator NreC
MRVALITSEPVFRLGFRALIEASGDLRVVAEAADARSGFEEVDRHQPDVLVIDVSLPGMNGIAAAREVKRRAPRTQVLMVADWGRERDALEALAAGATGFALKTDRAEELLGAIRRVANGQLYIAPAFRRFSALEAARLARTRSPALPADVLRALSPREREVFDLVVRGWRNAAISVELCISIKTVDTHRTRIHRKLGCRSASELIRFAAENDLLRRAGGRDQRPGRTVLLMVDDDPQIRAEILRNIMGQGWRQIRASTASEALTELRSSQDPCLMVMDEGAAQPDLSEIYRQILREDPVLAKTPVMAAIESAERKPAVRAAASLPHTDGDERLEPVFEPLGPVCPAPMPSANPPAV